MVYLPTVIGAFAATGVELAEAALVVLVVIGRGHRRAALLGSAAAALVVVLVSFAVGVPVLRRVPVETLRLVLGLGLVGLGSFWLLRVVVAPQSAATELDGEARTADRWAQRGAWGSALICGKAVAVETSEAAVLVVAIGAPHSAVGSAVLGAVLAGVAVTFVGVRLERHLVGLAAHTLNRVAGTALLVIGSFWVLDGRHLPDVLTAGVGCVLVVLVAVAWFRRPVSVGPGRSAA